MKNLIVIGDSFCRQRGIEYPTSWVTQLGQQLDCKIYGEGLPGRGWWQQQEWFDLNLHKLPQPNDTAVIWCHTSAYRIPCESDASVNPWVVRIDDHMDPSNDITSNFDPDGKLFYLARDFYQSPLFVDKFYTWAMKAWWKELAVTLAPYKKVIHMFGFFDYNVTDIDRLALLAPNSVIVTSPSLGGLSTCDFKNFVGGVGDTRINHLNDHNNLQLALFLKNVLCNARLNSTVKVDNLNDWKFETQPMERSKILRWKSYGAFIKSTLGKK